MIHFHFFGGALVRVRVGVRVGVRVRAKLGLDLRFFGGALIRVRVRVRVRGRGRVRVRRPLLRRRLGVLAPSPVRPLVLPAEPGQG